jgi:arylsulfatase B
MSRSNSKPNVIIILTDDQGYGDLSCHGNPVLRTPHLDKLYDESIRLTDFHVSSVCTPTRAALLTGRDPVKTGIRHTRGVRNIMRADEVTMADVFSANGYRTGLFGKWHLGNSYPFRPQDRGFQETLYFGGWDLSTVAAEWNSQCFDDTYLRNGQPEKKNGYCTDIWFDEAMTWMQDCHERNAPFFTYIATNAPHWPWYVPDHYREPYQNLDHYDASFFGMIANVDENMGKLEQMLVKTGLKENTLLIFMTDNGTAKGGEIYNAGMKGKKGSCYEGGHRVPCFWRWPAQQMGGGYDVDELTAHIDILPTLIDLCELQKPDSVSFDGVSLAPLLNNQQDHLSERFIPVYLFVNDDPEEAKGAIMSHKWRFINGRELYHVGSDPGQNHDVAQKNPEQVSKMSEAYEKYWDEVSPRFSELARVQIGSLAENPMRLTCFEWHINQNEWAIVSQHSVRNGKQGKGCWEIEVMEEGEYTISLCRWPKEVKAALTSEIPPFQIKDTTFGSYPKGVALPIQRARLQIQDEDTTIKVENKDIAAVFQVKLNKGQTQLKATFYDEDGAELTDVYYVYVCKQSTTHD